MLIMDLLEIAPHNIGQNKRYYNAAACLIAFACRESFKLETNYKGYLIFVSKSGLVEFYINKYGANLTFGQKMYFDSNAAKKLIEKYLNFNKK